jgi:hypothetical protein
MTTATYSRETQCGRKARYMTRAEAKRAAKDLRRILGDGHSFAVYHCPHCHSYHFGHRVERPDLRAPEWRGDDALMTDTTPQTAHRYMIGLDGGVHTGMAVWDRETRTLVELVTLDFWRALDAITERYGADETLVVVEDPSKHRPVFARNTRSLESIRAAMKVAQNVGEVKRETVLLIEGLRRRGYTVETFAPTRSKPTEAYFRQLTGYEGRCSAHARDAAMFVFGR